MDIQDLNKESFVGAFRKSLGHLLPDKAAETAVMKWVWEEIIQPAARAADQANLNLEDARKRFKDLSQSAETTQDTLKAFLWNVHEIRKQGSTLFAFHGTQFCKGQTVKDLLDAYREQTKDQE
jgi:hypothetical protein